MQLALGDSLVMYVQLAMHCWMIKYVNNVFQGAMHVITRVKLKYIVIPVKKPNTHILLQHWIRGVV